MKHISISRGYKTSNAVCQDQVGSCPSSDFKFCDITNAEIKINIRGQYCIYLSMGSPVVPKPFQTQQHSSVTSKPALMPHSVELREKTQCLMTYFSFLVYSSFLEHHSKHQRTRYVSKQVWHEMMLKIRQTSQETGSVQTQSSHRLRTRKIKLPK